MFGAGSRQAAFVAAPTIADIRPKDKRHCISSCRNDRDDMYPRHTTILMPGFQSDKRSMRSASQIDFNPSLCRAYILETSARNCEGALAPVQPGVVSTNDAA